MSTDLLKPVISAINDIHQGHSVNHMTLTILLLKKGLIDQDELDAARAQATHMVEQEWASRRDELTKKLGREAFKTFLRDTNKGD